MSMAAVAANLSRRLEGMVAIITGGAAGIGEATVGLFTKHGAKVIIADVADQLGKKVVQSFSPEVTYIHCDVTRDEDVSAAVDLAVKKHGKLDIMFNNAGFIDKKTSKAVECDMDEFQRVMNVHIKGVMHGIKHAARVMIPNKKGCIISTSSIAGVLGGVAPYAYTASKHAVIGLTKQGASEMGKYGIRVNCVSPFGLASALALQFSGKNPMNLEEGKIEWEAFCNKISNLKDHTLKTHDIAEAALYLASNEAKFVSGHNLVVVLDGSEEAIELQGCTIRAVSGGDQSMRKWAKRYPIKMENKNRVLVYRSKVCFIYLETAWEKEAWCKALRLASRTDLGESDLGGVDWYCNLKKEFELYFQRVNKGYSSFVKLNSVPSNQRDTNIKGVIASSKARHFWKKFARKAPRMGYEVKTNSIPTSSQEEKKTSAKESRNLDSSSLADFSSKAGPAEKNIDNRFQTGSSSGFGNFGSQRQSVGVSDMDSEKTYVAGTDADHDSSIVDQGTLCCNLLFSRLFFDAERSQDVVARIQALIQRLLSKVRTPSYVGGINCTWLDLGKLPPHISNMRALPVSVGEAWALEVDIEYFGAALMDIETRLEVCEPSFQESLAGTSVESEIAVEKSLGFLNKDFESISNQLQTVTNTREKKDEEETSDGIKSSSGGSRRSWKGLLSHLADQVSQVPLALSIRVLSLKGTVRISIKPPPSDCIWFGFTAVPDIEWGFEPSIGDHKITSGKVAALIATRIKAAICETLVLPNCENICIPWMQAEKDDWVPQRLAPVPWIRQESSDDATFKQWYDSLTTKDDGHLSLDDHKSDIDNPSKENVNNTKNESSKSFDFVPGAQIQEQLRYHDEILSHPAATKSLFHNESNSLLFPLLDKDDLQDKEVSEVQTDILYSPVDNERSPSSIDGKSKKGLKRAKMLDLGKKVSIKLEEKRRHIEEKSRHIVEKMRGVEKNESTGIES